MSTDTIIKDEDSFVSNTDAIIYAASDISGWTQSLISDPNIPNSSNSTSVDDLRQQISTAAAAGGSTNDDLIVSFDRSKNNKKKSDQQEIRIFNVDFTALSTVVVCSYKDDEEDKGSESNKRLKSSAQSEFDGGLLAEIGGAAVCNNKGEEEDKGSESNKRLKSSAQSEFDGSLLAEIGGAAVCNNKGEEEDKGSESNKKLKSCAESEFDGGLLAEIGGAANKETSVRLVNNLDTAGALVRDIRIRGGSNVIKNT